MKADNFPKWFYDNATVQDFENGLTEFKGKKNLKFLQIGVFTGNASAWLHDVGYIWEPARHEARGAEYATSILTEMKFPKSKISLITGMIMATKIPQSPKNHVEQIICDADLDYLGRDDYAFNSNNLLQEIELTKKLKTKEWFQIQEKFLKAHAYFTPTSQKSRNKSKQLTLLNIQEQLKNI